MEIKSENGGEKEILGKYVTAARRVALRPEEKEQMRMRLTEAMKMAPTVVAPAVREQSLFTRLSRVVRKVFVKA